MIGNAARHCCGISPCWGRPRVRSQWSFARSTKGIEWDDPIRLRNRIVHGYWSVDIEVIVDTANDDLPVLIQSLEAVVGMFK